MADLPADVRDTVVRPGQLAIWALGQAGFLLKGAGGPSVAIDPYLSNDCAMTHGLERLLPPPVESGDLPAELVLISHWHSDHLDPGTIRLLANRSEVHFVAPASCLYYCAAWGVPQSRLHTLGWDQEISFEGVRVRGVYARHLHPWAPTPDANGYVIEFSGVRVYHTGDTEYDVRLRALEHMNIDVMIACSNGGSANLDAWEVAWLASRIKPGLLIPMHLDMFDYSGDPSMTVDPDTVARVYSRLVDDPQVAPLRAGEFFFFEKRERNRPA